MQIISILLTTSVWAAETASVTIPLDTKSALTTWILGGSIAAAIGGLFWWWMLAKFPDIFVNAVMSRVDQILKGESPDGQPISDEDTRQLVIKIGFLIVGWAEKKLPDAGLGEQRMQLVLDKLYSWAGLIPWLGARVVAKLKENESKIRQVISKIVEKMNTKLKEDAALENSPKADGNKEPPKA